MKLKREIHFHRHTKPKEETYFVHDAEMKP